VNLLNIGLMASLISMLSACGSRRQYEYIDDGQNGGMTGGTGGRSKSTISIPVSVRSTNGFSLNANATSFEIEVDSCASGYTSTATEASPSLEVYQFDRDCLAKLVQFVINGNTYEPETDFTTWAVNDTAIFENTLDNTDQLTVRVIATLDSPIDATDTVVYQFSDIEEGDPEAIGETVVGQDHTMEVSGQAAPDFRIHSVALTGITTDGAGQFEFVMDCKVAISGVAALRACRDVAMVNVDYRLVEDTYGGTLSVAQADAIFDGSEDVVAAGHLHDSGPTSPNGGFTTVALDGPDQMHLNNEMLLVLRASGISFQYFKVTVTTVSQD
jgi:hypothetical protein